MIAGSLFKPRKGLEVSFPLITPMCVFGGWRGLQKGRVEGLSSNLDVFHWFLNPFCKYFLNTSHVLSVLQHLEEEGGTQ